MIRILKTIAHNSVGYHDAQDLVSDFMMRVWAECEVGKHRFNDEGHARAHYVKCFKHRVVDYIRERGRYNKAMEGYTYVHARWDLSSVYANCTLNEIRAMARNAGGVVFKAYRLVENGFSIPEAGAMTGIPKTSIYRAFRERLALRSPVERVSDEEGDPTTEGKEIVMPNYAMSCKNGVVSVMDGPVPVARATINDRLQVESVVLQKKGVDREELVDSIMEYVKSSVTLEMIPKRSDDAKEKMKMPTKKEVEDMKKAKAAKKAKDAPVKPDLPVRKAIDLTTLKDVPATLDKWIAQCGGDGYCLGGSGQPVARRFRPGYDAKLKSVLKRLGTANAKALAKELGWFQMIKWEAKKAD